MPPLKQESVRDYYQLAGANVVLNLIDNLWHGYPSVFWPDWNGTYKAFDGVGNILKHLFENLLTGSESVTLLNPNTEAENYLNAGVLRKFSQTEFSEELIGFSEDIDYDGYVWIPNACLSKQCKVHMVFHGCGGGISSITQTAFKGFLEIGWL